MKSFRRLRRHSRFLILLFAGSFCFASENWPKKIDPYMKTPKGCDLKRFVRPESTPAHIKYQTRVAEEACRLESFEKELPTELAHLCPGITPDRFSECFRKVLEAFTKDTQWTISGYILYLKAWTGALVSHKEDFRNHFLALKGFMEIILESGEALSQRAPLSRSGYGEDYKEVSEMETETMSKFFRQHVSLFEGRYKKAESIAVDSKDKEALKKLRIRMQSLRERFAKRSKLE